MSRRAAFIDRDGTIVRGVEYLRSPDELEILPNAAEAIRRFNERGYLSIIVTNQSGIARGFFTEETLAVIHHRLLDMLSEEGARIDAVYYCPHLAGGAVEPYGIDCQCRKPRPGMLEKAAREHDINLSESIMIGDTPADIMAGKAAGCKTVLVQPSGNGFDMPESPDLIVKDLMGAVKLVS